MSTSSFLNLPSEKWEVNINKMLQHEDVADTPTCIYKVPHRLRDLKPEAYTPHYMGLGPYHHWRDDLYAMEAYKLIASMKSQEGYHNEEQPTQRLQRFVDCLQNQIARIHASYDRHLDMNARPLALMMVIDGIFLLEFLQELMRKDGSCLKRSKRTRSLVETSKSAYHSILQDIMMLENQIPIFVLEHILSLEEFNEQDSLPKMLCNTCMKLSPFKLPKRSNLIRSKPTYYAHLLELLYYLIVPEKQPDTNTTSLRCHDVDREELLSDEGKEKPMADSIPSVTTLPNLAGDHINLFKKIKPLRVIDNMINLVSNVMPSIISNHFSNNGREGGGKLNDLESGGRSNSGEGNNHKEAPKVDEIKIPSVKDLLSVGIEFCPINENESIEYIKFNKKSRKFYLPSITINDNTEVIIRNLVAYEAVGIPGTLVLARYTELMNGIIDTAEDVKHLRERKIIVSYLKKDEDVAQLWNGMSRSIRLSPVSYMDGAIREVNKYYESKTRVKFIRLTKHCLLCAWKISMLLLTLVLLLLMAIQSFCEVYRCPSALQPVTKQGSN